MKNPILALLYTLLLLSSCGVSNSVTSNSFLQKRKYTNGWNVNNLRNQQNGTSKLSDDKLTETDVNEKQTASDISSLTKKQRESSFSSNEINKQNTLEKEKEFYENSLCDSIILNDGKIIRATILATTETTVNYTLCESDDPTEKTLAKDDIKALQYANGKFEFIPHKRETSKVEPYISPAQLKRKNERIELQQKKEKLTNRHIGLKLLLFVLFLCLIGFAGLFWGIGDLAVIVYVSGCLILSLCFLVAAIIAKIQMNRELKSLS